MIIRIVKMVFRKEDIPAFLRLFEERKATIRSFEGCRHVELWQSISDDGICFTYSIWENEAALEAYRHSDFFQETWLQTKLFFREKAMAWSVKKESAAAIPCLS